MRIGLYADLHASYTSSILPVYCHGSKYTTRLQMIIDTGRWMYDLFEDKNVDIICNLGDTFDSHIVRSEELSAMSEFYSYSRGIREITIVGNHEMLNHNFYANSILSNYDFIELYSLPTIVDETISVLPYMPAEDITLDMLKNISNKVLISHIDIKGSYIRPDYIMPTGVESEALAEYFDIVFNGHLHTYEKINTSKGIVMNMGNVSSISFSDSNSYLPSICIYDTDTKKIERYNNPYSILFRKFSVNSISDMINYMSSLDNKYRYAIRVSCPYNIRDSIKDIIAKNSNIIASRVVAVVTGNTTKNIEIVRSSDSDIKTEFMNFIKENKSILSAPIEDYISVLEDIRE